MKEHSYKDVIRGRTLRKCLSIVLFLVLTAVARADQVQIGTVNVAFFCGLPCGQATVTHNMTDANLLWQGLVISNSFPRLPPFSPPISVLPGDTSPVGAGWFGFTLSNFLVYGGLISDEFTVGGVLYQEDPVSQGWFTSWNSSFEPPLPPTGVDTFPIYISADPVATPEPSMLILLSMGLLPLSMLTFRRKRPD
jgi:hypothetical protein